MGAVAHQGAPDNSVGRGTYVETDCTITHDGHSYTAGGAYVTPDRITAYPGANGVLTDWHGNPLGTWRSVASWPVYSYMGDRMHQIEADVNGVRYTGRGFGEGMIYNGRRKAVRRVTSTSEEN